MLVPDGQVHPDTHLIPVGNYVIEMRNYVITSPSKLGNYVSADIDTDQRWRTLETARAALLTTTVIEGSQIRMFAERVAANIYAANRPSGGWQNLPGD